MSAARRAGGAAVAALLAVLAACGNSTGGSNPGPRVVLSPLVDTLYVADSAAAPSVTYYDASGAVQPAGPVSWSSGATGVATVDPASGEVHAVGPGLAVISATAHGTTGSALVVVTRVLDVSLLVDTIYVMPHDTFTVPVLVRDKSGTPPAPRFSAATNAVFTIDSVTGAVAGLSPGGFLPFIVHADSAADTGFVEVDSLTDTTGGKGYFTVLGSAVARRRASARAENYQMRSGGTGFRIFLKVAAGNTTVENLGIGLLTPVTAPDSAPLDSISAGEAQGSVFLCSPARPYGFWSSFATSPSLLAVSRPGGWIVVRRVVPVTGGYAISGSFFFDAQRSDFPDDPSGRLPIRGVFVAPLVTNPGTCQ